MSSPRTSLEEWAVLSAVAEEGSFARAGVKLSRSQSSISYMLTKLQERLGVELLQIEGRRSVLTAEGRVLLGMAREILIDAHRLEAVARHLSAGWEAEVRLLVDGVFPTNLLLQALSRFRAEVPHTQLRIEERASDSVDRALSGEADIVVSADESHRNIGEPLMQRHFVAVSHPAHALQTLGRPIQDRDLSDHTQIVTTDTDSLFLKQDERANRTPQWTVQNIHTSIAAVVQGLGFAWMPQHVVQPLVDQGKLRLLQLPQGNRRPVQVYMRFTNPELAGPATRTLGTMLRDAAAAAGGARRTKG
ncbi:LysR family transcriptional regulator [Caballeronia catudaia]|uniref:LysR family transcriptional regulator n=1 Tax=Caballeronia catudaia TaxID=1777136 RepID=A0A158DN30_9BURK|nr:LysR family transcriptional regulator [Caballeronia catudaia]